MNKGVVGFFSGMGVVGWVCDDADTNSRTFHKLTLYVKGWVNRWYLPLAPSWVIGISGKETKLDIEMGPPENFIG